MGCPSYMRKKLWNRQKAKIARRQKETCSEKLFGHPQQRFWREINDFSPLFYGKQIRATSRHEKCQFFCFVCSTHTLCNLKFHNRITKSFTNFGFRVHLTNVFKNHLGDCCVWCNRFSLWVLAKCSLNVQRMVVKAVWLRFSLSKESCPVFAYGFSFLVIVSFCSVNQFSRKVTAFEFCFDALYVT